MFKLTWRNLLARKVRLLMSALAIVLGVGFLAGVLTFSSGLSRTFDGIIEGSTPEAVARPSGNNPWEQIGAGSDRLLKPRDVRRVAALPEASRRLVALRYEEGLGAKDIAARVGRTPAAIDMALSRIRRLLRDCIERKITGGTS